MAECGRELDAFDDAVLRLKIGLDRLRKDDRSAAVELADDLANSATAFSRLGRCIGRAIARSG